MNLPTAPADKTRTGFKIVAVAGANTLTINCGGSTDVFNKAGGSAALVLSALFQGGQLQYKASTRIWYVTALESPLGVANGAASLDGNGKVPPGRSRVRWEAGACAPSRQPPRSPRRMLGTWSS